MGMRVGRGWLGLGGGGQCRLAGVAGRLSRRPRRFAWPLLVLSTAGGGGGGGRFRWNACQQRHTQAGGVGGGQKLLPPPAPPSTVCTRLLYARALVARCRCGVVVKTQG